jgi:polyisoprenoid-binding protein YceI
MKYHFHFCHLINYLISDRVVPEPQHVLEEIFMAIYQIDPAHSAASFSVKHMMIAKVHGGFEKLSGTLNYDPTSLSLSSVEAVIDARSINTREAQRDTHLKSADFFDVDQFPNITFKSSRFEGPLSDLKVSGDLTIHGVTKKVSLAVETPSPELKDPYGNLKIGISASLKIKRKDFGLTWNAALEAGGVFVADEVSITLDLQFAKQV